MAVWSEVLLSELTEDYRFDAEFYRPEYLHQSEVIHSMRHDLLASLADVSDGNHISIAESFTDEGVRYLRGQDLSDFFISDKDPVHIPISAYQTLRRSHMKPGDVLLGIVATIGTVSFVTDRFHQLTGNCKLAIVRPKCIEGEYLAAYFSSLVGQREIHRRARGSVQTGIILPDLKALPIPIPDDRTRKAIVQKVQGAYNQRQESLAKYAEAEGLLSSALGLDGLDLTARLYYERPYADLKTAARYDAEYFQPPKKAVLDVLAVMPGEPVSAQFHSVRQLWQPDKANPAEPVRNYDLTDALQPFLDDTTEPVTPDAISSTKKRLKKGDLVVSRLRSYLKEIAVVQDNGPIPMVGSTEFIVLRPQKCALAVEALLVYLRSSLVQTVLKWSQDGSNHPRFDGKELLNLRIPAAIRERESVIVSKVRESFAARREASRLLDEAKRMVEEAILGESCCEAGKDSGDAKARR